MVGRKSGLFELLKLNSIDCATLDCNLHQDEMCVICYS